MKAASGRLGIGVGITNSRLAVTKRGIAAEIAAQLGVAINAPVCLIGADPADRDVDRQLPRLIAAWGKPTRLELTDGPHHMEVANFARSRVCVASVSDHESVEMLFPILQARFRFLIIDAPSRAGFGVGIADTLLDWLDALVITTGLGAGELAETRRYLERLVALPSAQPVDARVLPIGDPNESGLAPAQLVGRLAALPTIGRVPRLAGPTAQRNPIGSASLEAAFRPIVRWIIDGQHHPASEDHVANRLYRESSIL